LNFFVIAFIVRLVLLPFISHFPAMMVSALLMKLSLTAETESQASVSDRLVPAPGDKKLPFVELQADGARSDGMRRLGGERNNPEVTFVLGGDSGNFFLSPGGRSSGSTGVNSSGGVPFRVAFAASGDVSVEITTLGASRSCFTGATSPGCSSDEKDGEGGRLAFGGETIVPSCLSGGVDIAADRIVLGGGGLITSRC
jgi:hypothetical protein